MTIKSSRRSALLAWSSVLAICASGAASGQVVIEDEDVIVDGSGDGTSGDLDSPLDAGGSVTVANNGDASLLIRNAGLVTGTDVILAFSPGSNGTVTVTGVGSQLTSTNVITVGRLGEGQFTLADGGTVNSRFVNIEQADSTVTITGPGSTWNASARFDVNVGRATIADGGALNAATTSVNGRDGEAGALTVTGTGSTLTTNGLELGNFGEGVLIVEGGGVVDSGSTLVGSLAGASGDLTVTGTGSRLDSSNVLAVGFFGDGELTIADGGTVTSQNGQIGYQDGSTGTVTITGEDSSWTMNQELRVGFRGAGTLVIEDGGAVVSELGVINETAGQASAATVSGTGSSWTNTGVLYVAFEGEGALWVEAGGQVSNTTGYIGHNAGSDGRATIAGAGSRWTMSDGLNVGESGQGALIIEDGGAVISSSGAIGLRSGSNGAVTVSGEDSIWTSAFDLNIANSGTGELTIRDGGHVATRSVTIGGSGAETGTLIFGAAAGETAVAAGTLDADSIWLAGDNSALIFNHTDDDLELDADISGAGAIRFLSGSTTLSGDNSHTGLTLLEGGRLVLGSDSALGTSILRTTGSVVGYLDGVTNASAIEIDSNTTQFEVLAGSATQSGVISERNGPRPFEKIGDGELILTAANTWTGGTTVSAGTLTFDGGSVALDLFDFSLAAASGDTAALIIRNGGSVSNAFSFLGLVAGATDSVTVTGAGSTWTNSRGQFIGQQGVGTLTIDNGGAVSGAFGVLGNVLDSSGAVTVTGAGSTWSLDSDLIVGNFGDAAVTIADGASLTSSGLADIALQEISSSSVTVTGENSRWDHDGTLWVATRGSGTLTVADGGAVSNGVGIIGSRANASGSVTISGEDSIWTNSSYVLVGSAGEGTLTIEDGGAVSSDLGYVGFQTGSVGVVTVTGAGSIWTNNDDLTVGVDGVGTVMIEDGGLATNRSGIIGSDRDARGAVTVTGANSRWTNTSSVYAGFNGTGSLTISDGGEVTTVDEGVIGGGTFSSGEVVVTGANSRFVVGDGLLVGFNGTGSLTIAEGGTVSAADAVIANSGSSNATLNIGAAAGDAAAAAGTLDVDTVGFGLGTGRLVFNHTQSVGQGGHVFGADISSTTDSDALIRNLAGFTRLTGDSTQYLGDLSVEGGVVSVDGALGTRASTTTVSSGAALTGSGTLGGDVTVQSGAILEGQSVQTLTITGDLELEDGAQVNVALGSPNEAELFAVGEDLTLDGTLTVTDAGGFGPGLYALFTYGGTLTDNGIALGAVSGGPYLPGEVQLQTTMAGQVNLLSSIGVNLVFWDGDAAASLANNAIDGGDGVWTAASETFTDADGIVNGPARPAPAFVVFAAAAGTVTVDDSAGDLSIARAQFASDGYVVEGDGIELVGNGDGESILRVGNGALAGADFSATIDSALSGDATLVKTDLGTLILAGANSYTGGTEVRGGTLIGTTTSIRGDIANAGRVEFDQAADAELDQDLSGEGVFAFAGGATFTLSGENTHTGGTEVAESGLVLTTSASAGTGAIALTDSTLAYADGLSITNTLTLSGANTLSIAAGSAAHGGALSGSGAFRLDGPGSLTLTGDGSGFTGATRIAGNLLLNGVLGGSMEVLDGGVLRGFGTAGSTRLLAGSTISPGNSVGTLTINGDLVFESGSLYEATALPDGTSDLINVTGTTTINGGSVLVVGSDSGFAPLTDYTILSSAGGITGSFDSVSATFAFLDPSLTALGGDLVLRLLRNDVEFVAFAETGNQRSVAVAIDTLGGGNPVWNAVAMLEEASAPAAFDALSGELHATQAQQLLNNAVHSQRAITSRLVSSRDDESRGAWVSGHFGGSELDRQSGVAGVSSDTSGLMLGVDTPVGQSARVGVVAAFGETSFNLSGRAARGSTDSHAIGAYASGQRGLVTVIGGAVFGWHDLTTLRTVQLPGLDEQLAASHNAQSIETFAEISVDGPAGFTPFVSIMNARLDTDAFTETGGFAALSVEGDTLQMTSGMAGTRFARDWTAGGTPVRLEGSLGWRHTFSGDSQFVSGDLSGAPVLFEGAGLDQDAAAVDAGFTIDPEGPVSLRFGYAGEFGSRARSQGAQVRARWTF